MNLIPEVKKMSSLDLMEKINQFRIEAGETAHEPRKFLAKVEDELELDATGKKFRLNNNQTQTAYYDLDEDQMMLVGMRESKKVRRKVLDMLKSISSQAPALPQTFSEALQLAADQAKQLEEQAPKVEFVDKYVASDTGNNGFRQVAKLLKVKENWFREFLVDNKIMYRLGGEWMPHQNHIDAGRFEVKAGTKNEHAYNTAKFTPKGVQWIAELIGDK